MTLVSFIFKSQAVIFMLITETTLIPTMTGMSFFCNIIRTIIFIFIPLVYVYLHHAHIHRQLHRHQEKLGYSTVTFIIRHQQKLHRHFPSSSPSRKINTIIIIVVVLVIVIDIITMISRHFWINITHHRLSLLPSCSQASTHLLEHGIPHHRSVDPSMRA